MPRFVRRPDNVISVFLSRGEAFVLGTLPDRLRSRLSEPDFYERVTRRLFPRAYADERQEKEYRRLLGEDLKRRKLGAIELFEKSLERCRLGARELEVRIRPEEFDLWLGFINDTRIMLGTELDIQDDDWGEDVDFDDPDADDLILLHFLTWLEEELLRSSGFDMPDIDPEKVRKKGKRRRKRKGE